jgi:ABC-type sulfate transport system substrate-binding protein
MSDALERRMQRVPSVAALLAVAVAFALMLARNVPGGDADSILNVSNDPARELYEHIDTAFEADLRAAHRPACQSVGVTWRLGASVARHHRR